jgi:hypothetical protein
MELSKVRTAEEIIARESGSVPATVAGPLPVAKPQRVRDIRESEHIRLDLGNPEVNRVLGGGILYTVGGVLYAVKWPGRDNPRFGCHEIFHLFILMGSVFHFMLMYRVVAFL